MKIRASNQIGTRFYDLELIKDGEIVGYERGVSDEERQTVVDQYHADGILVNSTEVTSLTRASNIVGENPFQHSDKEIPTGKFTPGTAEMTHNRISNSQHKEAMKEHEKMLRRISKENASRKPVRKHSIGRDKNSPMHADWIAAIKKNGYKVHNLKDNKFFYGFESEVIKYLSNKVNHLGYQMTDFEIKFLGK